MDDRAKDVTNYDVTIGEGEHRVRVPLDSVRDKLADPTAFDLPGKKRRGRPPKVRMPEGVVKAGDETSVPPNPERKEPGDYLVTEPTPLLTLHLRRAKNEITDTTGKVHIPASGAIPDGTRLVAHFYRED